MLPSRARPLKLSMNVLSTGFPGRLKITVTPRRLAHWSSAFEVNSGPLSTVASDITCATKVNGSGEKWNRAYATRIHSSQPADATVAERRQQLPEHVEDIATDDLERLGRLGRTVGVDWARLHARPS